MGVNCLKCINSACCKKYEVEVTADEYKKLVSLGYKNNMITYKDKFIDQNPKYKNKGPIFEQIYKDKYAILKKENSGYCVLMDPKTMLCTIYQDRPKVCAEFKVNRCAGIRQLTN